MYRQPSTCALMPSGLHGDQAAWVGHDSWPAIDKCLIHRLERRGDAPGAPHHVLPAIHLCTHAVRDSG